MENNVMIVENPTQDWTVYDVATKCVPTGWEGVFENATPELRQISEVLEKDKSRFGQFYPHNSHLFAAFEAVPLNIVRVILIGQDPYPTLLSNGKCRAIGRSFSVRKDDDIPQSLSNMFKELEDSIEGFKIPSHGNLRSWEKQGVLLLNTSLTYSPGRKQAGEKSHFQYGVWFPFLIKVFNAIAEVNPRCIYLLLGREAEKLDQYLGDKAHRIIAAHPSPLSAHRGFFGSKCFARVNEILVDNPIDWNLD